MSLYVEEFLEDNPETWDKDVYFINIDSFSEVLNILNNALKESKEFYGGKKLKADFLIFYLIRKDIEKGLIDKINKNNEVIKEINPESDTKLKKDFVYPVSRYYLLIVHMGY